MKAIYLREMRAYFTTPIGYIYLFVYFLISGAVFSYTTLFSMSGDSSTYFLLMLAANTVLVPLLTMKSFSEEKKQKTEQLLLTAPVSLTSIVLGKFFAAYTVFAGSAILSALPFGLLYQYTVMKTPILLGSLLALLLVGLAFASVGIFVSSVTENQLAAAVGTIGILLFFMLISLLNNVIPFYFLRFILNGISIYARFINFTNGIFDVASLVYYLTICAVFLFLTVRVFARRRHV